MKNVPFKRFTKVLDRILSVIRIVLLISIPLMLLGLVVLNVLPTSVFQDSISKTSFSIDLSQLSIFFTIPMNQVSEIKPMIHLYSVFLITGSVIVTMAIYIIQQIRIILKNVLKDTPFSNETVKHTKRLGISIIVASVVTNLLMAISESMYLHLLNIEQILMENHKIDHVTINLFKVDGVSILLGLLVLLLANVFQYGNQLQEEVDATI